MGNPAARTAPYRACKELGLDLGNVHAYLNKGDVVKAGRGTARQIMEFACR